MRKSTDGIKSCYCTHCRKRKQPPEVFCKKDVFKNFTILAGKHLCSGLFLTLLKETPTQVFSVNVAKFLRTAFFIKHLCCLLINIFTESQKETVFSINHSVMKTFRCSFPIDLAFNVSMRCSECTTQPETIFFSVDFLVAI